MTPMRISLVRYALQSPAARTNPDSVAHASAGNPSHGAEVAVLLREEDAPPLVRLTYWQGDVAERMAGSPRDGAGKHTSAAAYLFDQITRMPFSLRAELAVSLEAQLDAVPEAVRACATELVEWCWSGS